MKRLARANIGGTGEVARGTYCTPKKWAELVGPWGLDPFSNPRSHIVSARSCQLERGDDGLAAGPPGTYRTGGRIYRATATTKVFLQPPYELVLEAIAHYGHTRFCALLRFDTSTTWYSRLRVLKRLTAVPLERLEFEPPPGIESEAAPFPHAFYFARREDAPPELLRRCEAWTRKRKTDP